METLMEIMREIGLPFAYHHFAEGESPDPPFICFLTYGSDNFAADGRSYFKIDEINVELYTDIKSPELEQTVEAVLDRHGIFYQKTEVGLVNDMYIESDNDSETYAQIGTQAQMDAF